MVFTKGHVSFVSTGGPRFQRYFHSAVLPNKFSFLKGSCDHECLLVNNWPMLLNCPSPACASILTGTPTPKKNVANAPTNPSRTSLSCKGDKYIYSHSNPKRTNTTHMPRHWWHLTSCQRCTHPSLLLADFLGSSAFGCPHERNRGLYRHTDPPPKATTTNEVIIIYLHCKSVITSVSWGKHTKSHSKVVVYYLLMLMNVAVQEV